MRRFVAFALVLSLVGLGSPAHAEEVKVSEVAGAGSVIVGAVVLPAITRGAVHAAIAGGTASGIGLVALAMIVGITRQYQTAPEKRGLMRYVPGIDFPGASKWENVPGTRMKGLRGYAIGTPIKARVEIRDVKKKWSRTPGSRWMSKA